MESNFKKIRSKATLAAVIRAILFALATGLLAMGGTMIVLKLLYVIFNKLYYYLIGGGVALVSLPIYLLVFLQSKKKTAKRLDEEYGLEEKVQTMLEYENEESAILTLQREDITNRLKSIKHVKFHPSKLLSCLLAMVIGASAFYVGGFVVEDPIPPIPPEEPIYELDEFDVKEIDKIIEAIGELGADESLVNEVKAFLTTLKTTLSSGSVHLSEAKPLVSATIVLCDKATAYYNTYPEISSGLRDHEEYEEFGKMFYSAGTVASNSASMNFEDYNTVQKYAKDTLKADVVNVITDYMITFSDSFEDYSDISQLDALGLKYVTIERDMLGVLDTLVKEGSLVEPATDGDGVLIHPEEYDLYWVMHDFGTSFGDAYRDYIEGTGGSVNISYARSLAQMIDRNGTPGISGTFVTNSRDVLCTQAANYLLDMYVRSKLASVFMLSGEEMPKFSDYLLDEREHHEEEGEEGDDGPGTNPGGPGSGGGNEQYASDDMVYDSETGKMVRYGELLERYSAKLRQMLEAGEITKEMYDIMFKYYKLINDPNNKI